MLKYRYRFWVLSVVLCMLLIGGSPIATASIAQNTIEAERMTMWNGRYAQGEILLKVRGDFDLNRSDANFLDDDAALTEYTELSEYQDYGYIHIISRNKSTLQLMDYYLRNPEVIAISPNYERQLAGTLPNDALFNDLWGLDNTGQKGGKPDADIDAPEAWEALGDSGEVVLVNMDTGIDYNHPDLQNNVWRNQPEANGEPGLDDDGNGYVDDVYGWDFAGDNAGANDNDPMDQNGHGTHISGTMAAVMNNNIGVAGVCPVAKVITAKVFRPTNVGFDSDILEAINYILRMKAAGVNIVAVNASYGGAGYNSIMKDAIASLNQAGIIFCAAAGNKGTNTDNNPYYPSSYDLPGIISVAASDRNDALAVFSNYGTSSVDLAAPGADILSCYPNNAYMLKSGTSMAAPHVTGAVGFLSACYPSDNISVRINRILASADHLASLQGKCATAGRLNLGNAVGQPPPPPNAEIHFSTALSTIYENAVTASIQVIRTNNSQGTVSVEYKSSDIEARAGEDYVSISGTLVFADGQTLQTITVPIIDDTLHEEDESLQLSLSNPVGGILASPYATKIVIADNDQPPVPQPGQLQFRQTSYNANETDGAVNIEVIRTNGSDGNISVAYNSSNGTAISGADYTPVSGSLEFAQGETSKTISIALIDDSIDEATENFYLNLLNPTGGAILGDNLKAAVQIIDNDTAQPNYAQFQFSSPNYEVTEGKAAQLNIIRTGSNDGSFTVTYCTTMSGTATMGMDYTPVMNRVIFGQGETLKTIKVSTLDDTWAEGPETTTVALMVPKGSAVLGEPSQAVLTIIDND